MNIPRIFLSTVRLIPVCHMGSCTCTTTHERMAFDCSFTFDFKRPARCAGGGMCMFKKYHLGTYLRVGLLRMRGH